MPNLGTVVSKILTDVNRGAAHAQRVKQAISDAIVFFENKRLGFNQLRQETMIQKGDEYIPLPENWMEVDLVRLQDGTRRKKLDEVGYEWIEDNLRDDTYVGEPRKYAIQAREFRIFPIVDRTYSLMMMFLLKYPECSASADDAAINPWVEEGELLVRTYAQGELLVNYIGGDSIPVGEGLMSFAIETLLPRFESQAAREQSAGKFRGTW
jgi:hypothetical protein